MDNAPLVSIIIPAYNTELYIGQMLDCVSAQTYSHLEIIVIDDGSSDSTAEIVREKSKIDSRITLIQIKNSGVSYARNIGLSLAKGEKIFFWDSDDIVEPTTVASVVEFSRLHNVNSVLYGYSNFIDGIKGTPFPSKLKEIYRGKEIVADCMPAFLGHSFGDVRNWIDGKCSLREGKEHTALWRVMLDSSIIKKNHLLFDNTLSLGEDTKFINSYLLYEDSIGYLNKCFYYLRKNNNGLNMTSNADPILMTRNKLKLIQARKEIDLIAFQKHGLPTTNYWKGTVVFSAIQLAIRLSKNNGHTFKENYLVYKAYMTNDDVKQCVNEFDAGKKIRSIPFMFLRGGRWKLLFVLCKLIPGKLVNHLG